jgi:hypothetical protein
MPNRSSAFAKRAPRSRPRWMPKRWTKGGGSNDVGMNHYLWQLRPYFRQVTGQLVLGSITGILMNTAIVLPAILLGQAIDTARAYAQGAVEFTAVGRALVRPP